MSSYLGLAVAVPHYFTRQPSGQSDLSSSALQSQKSDTSSPSKENTNLILQLCAPATKKRRFAFW